MYMCLFFFLWIVDSYYVCVLWCICDCIFVFVFLETMYIIHLGYVYLYFLVHLVTVFGLLWFDQRKDWNIDQECVLSVSVFVWICIPHREVGWDVEFAQRTGCSDEATSCGYGLQSSHCETETNKSPHHTGWDQCESDTNKHTPF